MMNGQEEFRQLAGRLREGFPDPAGEPPRSWAGKDSVGARRVRSGIAGLAESIFSGDFWIVREHS